MNNLSMAKSMMGSQKSNPGQTTTAYGVATTGSVNGLVMIDMGGDTVSPDDDQSIECETTFKVFEGDEVIVSLVGADGSGKTPTVVGVVGRGDQMQSEIDNVKNYFWTNDRGAHISTIEHSIAGNNVLIDADSLDVRYGNTNDENDQILLARFGRNTAYIGGLDGVPYWTIKDLRDGTTKLATIEDVKYGDGIKYEFTTDFEAHEIISVYVNGIELDPDEDYTFNSSTSSISFANIPGQSIPIIITYTTYDGVFSYSEGIRRTGVEGPYSKANGLFNIASGSYSQASGYNTESRGWGSSADGYMTIANSRLQKVFGQANVADDNNTYLEIVGIGNTALNQETETITTDGTTSQFTILESPHAILTATLSGTDDNYFTGCSATASSQAKRQIALEIRWNNIIPYRFTAKISYSVSYTVGSPSEAEDKTATGNIIVTLDANTHYTLYTATVPNSTDVWPWNIVVNSISMELRGISNFETGITFNGNTITLPQSVYTSDGMTATITYSCGSLVRQNAYNLDWDGNAEYKGTVYLGGCTPNGETPYSAVRFNAQPSSTYYPTTYREEYYDGTTWKVLAQYFKPNSYEEFGYDPNGDVSGVLISRPLIGNGHITDSGKSIRLDFNMPKSLSLISNITIEELYGGMRGIKGYINSSAYGTNWLNVIKGSGYSYQIFFEGTVLHLLINKSSAFSNYTNNTPIAFETVFMQLGFDISSS